MTWFYKVSHTIMTSNASGEPPRSGNHEVLVVHDEQAESVKTVCRRVAEMGRATIESKLFLYGTP